MVGSEPDQIIPTSTELFANYPNPFNPTTTISFSLTAKDAKSAKLEIYNLKGQKVKIFTNLQITQSQNQKVIWNGADEAGKPVSSGVYFYQLSAGKETVMRKMLLLK